MKSPANYQSSLEYLGRAWLRAAVLVVRFESRFTRSQTRRPSFKDVKSGIGRMVVQHCYESKILKLEGVDGQSRDEYVAAMRV